MRSKDITSGRKYIIKYFFTVYTRNVDKKLLCAGFDYRPWYLRHVVESKRKMSLRSSQNVFKVYSETSNIKRFWNQFIQYT